MPLTLPPSFETAMELLSHFESPSETDARTATHGIYWMGRLLSQPGPGGASAKDRRRSFETAPLVRLLNALAASPPRNSKGLSQAAWGLGKVWPAARSAESALASALGSLDASAVCGGSALDAQAVAAMLHVHGTVGVPLGGELLRGLERRIASLAHEFKPQDVANSLWALARLGASADPGALTALGEQLVKEMPRFKPVELSSSAWALAKLDPPPAEQSELMGALHAALHADGGCSAVARGLSAQGVSNCLWAFSRAGPAPPAALVEALLQQAERQARALTPQGVANVCGAAARLGGDADVLIRLLGADGVIDSLGATDVAEVGWALGATRQGPAAPPGSEESRRFDEGCGWLLGALWRRAARLATQLSWQEASHLEFGIRCLHPSEPATGIPHGASEAAALLPKLRRAALASVEAAQADRGLLDASAVTALLAATPWSRLARGSSVLLASVGCEANAHAAATAAMSARGLNVSSWNRFADALLPPTCPPAASWPPAASPAAPGAAGAALHDAVVLRLPPSRAALEFSLHAAASVLARGGLLVVFGCHSEGMLGVKARLPSSLFEAAEVFSPHADAPPAAIDPPRSALTVASVLTARRTRAAAERASVESWESRAELSLPPRVDAPEPPPALPWTTLPGLFAAGGLDVMTAVLLANLPPPPPRARVLDFCCGSGSIGAALACRTPSLRLHLLDADAVAVHAARRNVAARAHVVSDGWASLPPKPRFDLIVSNPPVHNGLQVDFRVLRALVDGAAARLRKGGRLWLVCQEYVPVGALIDAQPRLVGGRAAFDDGRFVLWTATKATKEEVARAKAMADRAAEEASKGDETAAGPQSTAGHPASRSDAANEEAAAPAVRSSNGRAGSARAAPGRAGAVKPGDTAAGPKAVKRNASSGPCDFSLSKAARKRARRREAAKSNGAA